MNRLSRISTIWRKELVDTLRDRRTLIAMIFVPLVLYPAMMLGSLQGFELQLTRLKQQEYKIAVVSEADRDWLRRVIDSDPARQPGAEGQPAEVLVEKAEKGELGAPAETQPAPRNQSAAEAARADVRQQPPPYEIVVVADVTALKQSVAAGGANVGVLMPKGPPPPEDRGTTEVTLVLDQTDIRSQIASSGLEGIFQRADDFLLAQRLRRAELKPEFIRPIDVRQDAIATPEKVGGSILGQIVPLILIVMTITGAIYPAIDLTAGERERGTLETLMVAPVPTVDLIAGKFVVVALIAMISAVLNLVSIGGTIYLGGLGKLLSQGGAVVIPLHSLPLVLIVLIPLAIMFSAVLLAVCSFARSFKEAQNYVMPVMVAALIPAVVGILPGTRLEGPLLIMPVTNIVILTRDLFMDRIDVFAVLWVTLSTTLYAGAAVAVATKLFGQEAVLFADSGSIKTIFQRRFFQAAAAADGGAGGALAGAGVLRELLRAAIAADGDGNRRHDLVLVGHGRRAGHALRGIADCGGDVHARPGADGPEPFAPGAAGAGHRGLLRLVHVDSRTGLVCVSAILAALSAGNGAGVSGHGRRPGQGRPAGSVLLPRAGAGRLRGVVLPWLCPERPAGCARQSGRGPRGGRRVRRVSPQRTPAHHRERAGDCIRAARRAIPFDLACDSGAPAAQRPDRAERTRRRS